MSQFFNGKIQDYFLSIVKMSQDYYPESLGKIMVINCPWIVYAIYAVVKPFLAKATKERVSILRGDDATKRVQERVA